MRTTFLGTTIAAGWVLLASTAAAQGAKPLAKCGPDAVVSGTVCMDKYEASVWRVPDPLGANKILVKRIQQGTATAANLVKGGATQLGVASDDYAPCADGGQNCTGDIYAVSLPGVTPARFITWFQAVQACKNSRKRLPTNVEWQAAVEGTPDPGPDNGTTDCNSATNSATLTGSRSSCVSTDGAFDMVGNLHEWVADWVPETSQCASWGASVSPTDDSQCLGGSMVSGRTAALRRGGGFLGIFSGPLAGPLAAEGWPPAAVVADVGFRCAR
jgi:hypothetical protein